MAVLQYRTTELRDLSTRRCWFSIVSGYRDGLLERRPETVIPGASGQTVETAIADMRVIHLTGIVLGTSESNWDSVMSDLATAFDPTAAAANLVVTSPYMGLAAGTKTISAIVDQVRTNDLVPYLVTEWDVILHALGSPPDWA